jgi:small subunit ribosomal protein S20
MANTKQAKKRAAQNDKQKARNRAVKSSTRRTVKATRAAAPEKAKEMLPVAASSLDVAARKGVLHKNTVARLKSRIAKAVNKKTARAD